MLNLVSTKIKKDFEIATKNSQHNILSARRRNFIHEHYEVPLAVKLLKIPQNQRILQVGCGMGYALSSIACLCQPSRLVGIDTNERHLKRAKRRLRVREIYAELFQEDVHRMPFPDASFDIVIDFGSCYNIQKSDLVLLEITRILRNGGILVYESCFKQFFMHPIRSYYRKIPWRAVPCLRPHRSAILWSSRVKGEFSQNGQFSKRQ